MPKQEIRPRQDDAKLISGKGDQPVNAWSASVLSPKPTEPEAPLVPLLVNQAVAAKMLMVSKRHIYDLEEMGMIESMRLGRCKRYSVAMLKAFVEKGGK